MIELLRESILPVNLPFTILLGVVAVYWIVGLIGLVDLDGMGGGLDVGSDGIDGIDGIDGVDVGGAEVDGVEGIDGGDSGAHSFAGTFFNGLLKAIGASDAPVIFVLSVFVVILWGLNMVGNHYFNPEMTSARATIVLIPVVIAGFIMTRLLVRPLRPLMNMIRDDEKPVVIIGSSGVVRSSSLDADFGEVSVETEENTLILRARISDEDASLKKGDPILVVSKDNDSDTYLVRALD